MENIRELILLIFGAISFGVAIYKCISSAIHKAKAKALGEEVDEETVEHDKIFKLVTEVIPLAMQYAEKNGGSSETKKLLAMSKLMLDCNTLNLDFSKYQTLIDQTIEKFISLTKNVNTNGEQK